MTTTTPRNYLGLQNRVGALYRGRRRRLLEIPSQELQQRFGVDNVQIDSTDYRAARYESEADYSIEVGFKGNFRMFGALIDTQWLGLTGTVDSADPVYKYRFDKKRFMAPKGGSEDRAVQFSDQQVQELAATSELKTIMVTDGRAGRRVEIIPLAGTLTAVYFPPMPPYSVPLKTDEAASHLRLLEHLLEMP